MLQKLRQKAKDYCTHAPEGNWAECCKEHDLDYLGRVSRLQADNKLFKCVKAKRPWYSPVPYIMWLAVRVFGGSHYNRKDKQWT